MSEMLGHLGIHLVRALADAGLTREALRTKLGVSSAVMDQLFYYDTRPNIRQPKIQILRSVSSELNLDLQKLLSLADYNIAQDELLMNEGSKMSLGEFIEHAMNHRQISHNRLSELAGVSQGTIHNLAKQGRDSNVPGPHPRVLRAVCEVLGLDQLVVFQMAGYIDQNYQPLPEKPSAVGAYVQRCFESLSPVNQAHLLMLLEQLQVEEKVPLSMFDEVP